MKIDKATLESYINELGFSDQVRSSLLTELEADETRAEKFVSQRLRQSDYTKKTQELADQRKSLEGTVSTQVREYATKLADAEQKMNKVLKDLENEQISRSTAETRLQRLKVQYELSDEDIPKVDVLPKADNKVVDIDIDAKLKQFKNDLVKELMPELMSFPRISALQQEIREEHFDLTGKRLSAKDLDELTQSAGEKGGLKKAWEEKFGINDLRTKNYETGLEKKHREKWDAELKAKQSEAALAGVRDRGNDDSPKLSPILQREFENRADDGNGANDKGTGNDKGGPANKSGNKSDNKPAAHKMSGADRAAVKFMERRNQGIPLGKEAAAK